MARAPHVHHVHYVHMAPRGHIARACLVGLAFTAGCGESEISTPNDAPAHTTDAAADGRVGPDAPAGTAATTVDCASVTPQAEVHYAGGVLTPKSTAIGLGQVVRFHALGVHTAWHTNGLFSATGDDEVCVRFDAFGAYPFNCYFHTGTAAEDGTVTVQ